MNKIIAIAIALTLLAAACKTSQNTDQTETQAKEIDAEQLFKDSVKRVEQLILELHQLRFSGYRQRRNSGDVPKGGK